MNLRARAAQIQDGAAARPVLGLILGICACSAGGAEDGDAPFPRFSGLSPTPALPAMMTSPTRPSGAPGSATGFVDETESGEMSPSGVNDGCGSSLLGVLRDFHNDHPDFNDAVADDRGLVQDELGPDRKPVYAPTSSSATTTGAANFNQWYRDTPGVNQSLEFTFPFVARDGGVLTYDDPEFFPLDDQLFGNEYLGHNFSFTSELHTDFAYRGGEVFTFTGDDDLWVFINGRLAIDLGGVHPAQTESFDLDARAASFGLEVGGSYPLDLFHAERHAANSTFRVDTTLSFVSCGTIILR
jgi:fibro-slime domain-containing protein